MDENIKQALSKMILSASGWRKIFTEDEDEMSLMPTVSQTDGWMAYVAGITFARYLSTLGLCNKKILLARDSRPTGGALVSHLTIGFSEAGYASDYLGITTITEFLAYVRNSDCYDAFFYVSASHNPVGYNGFKFGLGDGTVLGGRASQEVIQLYKELLSGEYGKPLELNVKPVLANSALKLEAFKVYRNTMHESLLSLTEDHITTIRTNIAESGGFGVVIDFNGSARISSIDRTILESLGIQVQVMGEQLGQFHHAIVPEGDSLIPCQQKLEELHKADPAYQLGVVVDCDGDRGNLVYINNQGKALSMDAQTTFSLSVVSTLIYAWSSINQSLSVVVNDATSLRVEKICQEFGASCHWAETGEANVLAKAQSLRNDGDIVPICGEGSNGGTIIYPGTVRDPLTTLFSLVNVLFMAYHGQRMLATLQRKLGAEYGEWSVGDIVGHLPTFTTTSVVAPEALVRITQSSYQLKCNYLSLFEKAWPLWQKDFPDDKLFHYEVYHYDGIEMHRRLEKPSDGGMRIHLKNHIGEVVVALWMRGSKTEPVFRLMTDSGGLHHEEIVARWHKIHRELILSADRMDRVKSE